MNQLDDIVTAIKFEQSDEGQVILSDLDSKKQTLCTVPKIGSEIGTTPNFTLITFDDGDWISVPLDNVISVSFNHNLRIDEY